MIILVKAGYLIVVSRPCLSMSAFTPCLWIHDDACPFQPLLQYFSQCLMLLIATKMIGEHLVRGWLPVQSNDYAVPFRFLSNQSTTNATSLAIASGIALF